MVRKQSSMVLALATALITVGAFTATGAAAAREAAPKQRAGLTTHSVHVRYDDLDLTTDAGMRALYARLSAASKRACGYLDTRSAGRSASWRRCRAEAMANALEQLDDEHIAGWIAATASADRRPEPRITSN